MNNPKGIVSFNKRYYTYDSDWLNIENFDFQSYIDNCISIFETSLGTKVKNFVKYYKFIIDIEQIDFTYLIKFSIVQKSNNADISEWNETNIFIDETFIENCFVNLHNLLGLNGKLIDLHTSKSSNKDFEDTYCKFVADNITTIFAQFTDNW